MTLFSHWAWIPDNRTAISGMTVLVSHKMVVIPENAQHLSGIQLAFEA